MKLSSKMLFAILTVVVLVASGCGGDGTTPPPPPPDMEAPSVAIQSPTADISYLAESNTVNIGGIASDDIGVTSVKWEVDNGGAGDAIGKENWSANGIPLVTGDNVINVTAYDAAGKSGQDKLTVTVNEYLTFLSKPRPVPSGFFVGDPTEVVITITIAPNPNLIESSVHLLELDENNDVIVDLGQLYDDGDLGHGDDIKGDGVFSYIGTFDKALPGEIRLRVLATTSEATGDFDAFSAIGIIYAVEEISQAVADATVATQEEGDGMYYAYLASNTPDDAKQLTIAWLEEQDNVVSAEVTESGDIWINYTQGLSGTIVFFEEETFGANVTSLRDNASANIPIEHQTVGSLDFDRKAMADEGTAVLNNNALIYAPGHADANSWTGCIGCNFAITANDLLENSECPTFSITYLTDADADLAALDNISNYGFVVIMTHGFLHAGEVAFFSGEVYSFWSGYMIDWLLGRLTTSTHRGNTIWCVRPGYIASRGGTMPNSIVFTCACYNANNNSLANAFIAKGASTFFGFTMSCSGGFARDMANNLFERLVTQGQTTAEAFVPGQIDPAGDPALFKMVPAAADAYFETGLMNGGFEEGTLTGWTKFGDGRVITKLGTLSPTEGDYMGIISTGLGFTTTTGNISQTFCIGETETNLSLKWNFISEEFMEYIGSQYQDYFTIKLIESDSTTHVLFSKAIDDIAAEYSLIDVSPGIVFDQGDVYMTDWKASIFDVSAFRNESITLILESGDKGDSIYDTVILLDEIKIE